MFCVVLMHTYKTISLFLCTPAIDQSEQEKRSMNNFNIELGSDHEMKITDDSDSARECLL